jgi:putative chitinase
VNAADLRAIMPLAGKLADMFAAPLAAAMAEFCIDTPQRQASFLAQVAHESSQLRFTREMWGPTPAQRGYEGRVDLGNTYPGDGFRYRGRGLIQITGRDNYRRCGAMLGFDLLNFPDLLEGPTLASRSAAWFWRKNNLNALADIDDQVAICHRVNGGENGLAERLAFYVVAKQTLSLGRAAA